MNSIKNLNSEVWPVMLTPFRTNNEIDLDGLRKLTEFYIATGSTGLFANCLSSEMFQLTDTERIQITKTVVDQVKDGQGVIATGNFGNNIKESIEFIKRIYDTGIQGVVINSGLLALEVESDDVVKKNMEEILNGTGNIPFGIYECPVPYKRIISVNIMKWMAESGRFEFLKSTSCNLNEIQSKLGVTSGSKVKINNANIPTSLSSMKAGAHGIASIASNFYPELITYLANYQDKEPVKIEKLNTWLTIVDILIHQFYPMSAKYFLQKRGMDIQLNTRIPMGSFTYQDYIKFDELLNGFYLISEELEIDVHKF